MTSTSPASREVRKINSLGLSFYADTINGHRIDCEPSPDDIASALRDNLLESRPYHDVTLLPEWKANARSLEEWGCLVRTYHARRIAYLVFNGWTDPISIDKEGRITDGNHRVRAALFRGLDEIEVQTDA